MEKLDLSSKSIWRAILISLGILVLRSFVKEFIDNADVMFDSNHNRVYISEGNISRVVSILGICLHFFNLLNFVVMQSKSNKRIHTSAKSLFLIVPISLSLLINSTHWNFARIIEILVFLLYLFLLGGCELKVELFSRISRVFTFITLLSISYSFIFYERATVQCRQDKCTLLGNLNKSFFLNENYYGIFLVIGLCFLNFQSLTRMRIAYFSATLACVYTTGSRASYISLAVLMFVRIGKVAWRGEMSKFGSFGAVCFSLFFFITSSARELTGRGEIYRVIREALSDSLLTGYGIDLLREQYYELQTISFLPGHEHGTAALFLARFGVFGLIGFLFFLGRSFRRKFTQQVSYDAFLVLSVFGISEPMLNPSLYNDFGWIYFLI